MIEKILNKFGYIKKDTDILNMYVEKLPDLSDEFDEESEKKLMLELSNIDNFRKWINFVIYRDTKNYYMAVNDKQRDIIRGASQRMLDILKRLEQSNKPKVISTRISGIRYGS